MTALRRSSLVHFDPDRAMHERRPWNAGQNVGPCVRQGHATYGPSGSASTSSCGCAIAPFPTWRSTISSLFRGSGGGGLADRRLLSR